MNGLKVLSTGYYAPQKVLDNFDLEQMVETSDEWIVSRTGIKKRHIVENESCMDLGYQAALKAIEKIDKNKIGLIICATMTPDYFTPSMACLIQERLGLNEQEVMCFDLNAACSLSLIHIYLKLKNFFISTTGTFVFKINCTTICKTIFN